MAPVWRRNPPCDAHLKLDKMFEDKLISPADDPKKVRLKDPIFEQFSLPVFKGVWRELYAKHGVGCKSFYYYFNTCNFIITNFLI